MPTDEENGSREKRSANELIWAIRDALEKKGVEFGDKVAQEDVLQAVLDALESANSVAVNSMRVLNRGQTYGTKRETIIAKARAEYEAGGDKGRVTDLKTFINGGLREDGRSPMTEAEEEKYLR